MATEVFEAHGIMFTIEAHDMGSDVAICIERASEELLKLDAATVSALAAAFGEDEVGDGFEAVHTAGHAFEPVVSSIEMAGYKAAGSWIASPSAHIGHCPMVTLDIYRG